MVTSLVTAPSVEPITTAEAKLHIRHALASGDTTEDALINTLCGSAREYVETATRRKCITQTWDLKLDGFPCEGAIGLPWAPVASITSITYVDTAGDSQAWDSGLYDVDLPVGPKALLGRIVPAYGQSYPSTRAQINAVTVRFVVGYGSSGAAVPGDMLAAMKMLIAHWYEHRESVNIGNIVTAIPQSVGTMLWQQRAY